MKKIVSALFAIILFCNSTFASNLILSKTDTIRVMSYNIHHCNPPSKAKEELIDIPAIANVIKLADPDVVALQEVDVNTERSGKGIHEARELAKLTGMYFFFAKTIDFQGGDYGVAVLSKFPIVDSAAIKLPMEMGAGGEQRGIAVVTIKLKTGKQIIFASTHLDLKAENRLLQVAELNRMFQHKKSPVILAGDFNSLPESDVITALDKQFKRTCKDGCGFTIPQINPKRTIDFIFYKKPSQFEVLSHQLINETYASDHLPVMAELKLK